MSGEAEIRKKKIYRVTFIGFAVNLLLAGIKLAAGILGRSGAMVADAVHSFSDMATDVVVIAFAKISAKPKDEGHDYGHGKYETLATIIISLALAAVGTGCCPVPAPWRCWPPRSPSSSRRFFTAIRCAKAAGCRVRA